MPMIPLMRIFSGRLSSNWNTASVIWAETIDSLGRVVRQQQKVTDRTASRQEQQRIDRLEQTVEQQLHRAIQEHDSLWQERFAEYKASMRDSLSAVRDLQLQRSASNPVGWWQQLRLHLANIIIYAVIILAVVLSLRKRSWIRKILNR